MQLESLKNQSEEQSLASETPIENTGSKAIISGTGAEVCEVIRLDPRRCGVRSNYTPDRPRNPFATSLETRTIQKTLLDKEEEIFGDLDKDTTPAPEEIIAPPHSKISYHRPDRIPFIPNNRMVRTFTAPVSTSPVIKAATPSSAASASASASASPVLKNGMVRTFTAPVSTAPIAAVVNSTVASSLVPTPAPKKPSLWSTLKGKAKNALEITSHKVRKYLGPITTLGAAVSVGYMIKSDTMTHSSASERIVPQKISDISTVQDSQPSIWGSKSQITSQKASDISTIPDTQLSTGESLLNEHNTPAVQARQITPLEKGFLASNTPQQISDNTSLQEIVLGEKIVENITQQEPEKDTIIATSQEITPPDIIESKETKTIPLFVTSNGKKTVFIEDENEDGHITVDEGRLGLMKAVGNYKKNTPKMYKLAEELELNTNKIRPGNMDTIIQYSDITEYAFMTETLQVGEKSYTIYGNDDLALKLGKEKLKGTENLTKNAEDEKIIPPHISPLPPIPKAILVFEDTIPRAIPVFEDDIILPTLDFSNEDMGSLLPPKNPLPLLGNSDELINQRARSYNTTFEYVQRNGTYTGGAYMLLPENRESAQNMIESFLGTVDAIRATSNDLKQKNITLQEFYAHHVTFVDKEQTPIPLILEEFMRKQAQYTDLQIAQILGNRIPPMVIDTNIHDGKLSSLAGTWDTNGWIKAQELIQRGAQAIYGENPSMAELNEYFRQNVSLEKHPDIRTYRDFLQRVHDEEKVDQEYEENTRKLAEKETEKVRKTSIATPDKTSSKKSYLWFSVDDQKSFCETIATIQSEYTAKKAWAKDQDKSFPYSSVQEYADDNVRILDTQKILIPYGAALTRAKNEN